MAKASNHDDYIDGAAEWAQPILVRIRKAFHKAGKLNEEMKWSVPHFTQNGLIGSMAAFKKHVNLGFWNAAALDDPQGLLESVGKTNMGYMKVESLKDLPSAPQITKWAKQAIKFDAQSDKKPARKKPATHKPAAKAPKDLLAAIKANKKAQATWDKFPPSHKREYIDWVLEAKREVTRERRIKQAVEMMSEGKDKNWKYRK